MLFSLLKFIAAKKQNDKLSKNSWWNRSICDSSARMSNYIWKNYVISCVEKLKIDSKDLAAFDNIDIEILLSLTTSIDSKDDFRIEFIFLINQVISFVVVGKNMENSCNQAFYK